jgi:hypothetical protein
LGRRAVVSIQLPSTTSKAAQKSGCVAWSRKRYACPYRIIIGEVRREESLALLIALNSGLPR